MGRASSACPSEKKTGASPNVNTCSARGNGRNGRNYNLGRLAHTRSKRKPATRVTPNMQHYVTFRSFRMQTLFLAAN
eukprot:3285662-Pyramimonas_sp.AAC.1